MDKALTSTTTFFSKGSEPISSYDHFYWTFPESVGHYPEGKDMGEQLFPIEQGNRSTTEYTVEFQTLVAGSSSDWNEPATKAAYGQDL